MDDFDFLQVLNDEKGRSRNQLMNVDLYNICSVNKGLHKIKGKISEEINDNSYISGNLQYSSNLDLNFEKYEHLKSNIDLNITYDE